MLANFFYMTFPLTIRVLGMACQLNKECLSKLLRKRTGRRMHLVEEDQFTDALAKKVIRHFGRPIPVSELATPILQTDETEQVPSRRRYILPCCTPFASLSGCHSRIIMKLWSAIGGGSPKKPTRAHQQRKCAAHLWGARQERGLGAAMAAFCERFRSFVNSHLVVLCKKCP